MTRLSVIIVTYNSAGTIAPCLRSLRGQLPEDHFIEILVVDNASRDSTRDILRNELAGETILLNSENRGFAAAVNQGLEQASGDIILLINPDVVVDHSFLAELLEFFKNRREADIAGAMVSDMSGVRQPSCWDLPSMRTLALECFLPHSLALPRVTVSPDVTCEVKMVSGVCMAFRRKVYEQIGGFDERFFMFYEDADYCRRAGEEGMNVYFLAEAKIRHTVSSSSSENFPEFIRRIWKSRLQYIRKYHGSLYVFGARLLCLAGTCLKIPAYFLVGFLAGNRKFISLAGTYAAILPVIFGPLE